jgi:hypothetical protein
MKIPSNVRIFFWIFATAIFFDLVIFYGPWAGPPWQDIITHIHIAEFPSPDRRHVIEIEDVVTEGQFLLTIITSHTRFRTDIDVAGAVDVIAAAKDDDPLLRPRVIWTSADRVCLLAPRIPNMVVTPGTYDGVTVDVRLWKGLGRTPMPDGEAEAMCR